jgi:hypothetical protein
MDFKLKISEDEEIGFKISIDESAFNNDGDIIILFSSVIDGTTQFKVHIKDDEIEVFDKQIEFNEDLKEFKEFLEEFLVQFNPKLLFGSEENEIDTNEELEDETPYDPDKIRVDTKTFSLRQIYDMIQVGDINLTPDFQRNLVWDSQRKSRLVESVLMRIPLPMFYFAQDEDGRISVVDGLQRLSTIRDFMENKFSLRNLEYLGEKCDKKFYSHDNAEKAIEAKYFRWFNMTQITVNVIDPSSPFKLKYDIFRRINTGGQPLNSQEIRNCLSSDDLRTALKEMAGLDSFKRATGYSIKDVRMESQELALRFILFYEKYQMDPTLTNYSGNIESELNALTETLSKDRTTDYSEYIHLFDRAMKNSDYLFGRYSFRKCRIEHINANVGRQLINKALFVSWSVLLCEFETETVINSNHHQSLALPLAEKVTHNFELFQYLSYSTNSKANVQAIFRAAEAVIQENLTV